jgi:hypothetical protein
MIRGTSRGWFVLRVNWRIVVKQEIFCSVPEERDRNTGYSAGTRCRPSAQMQNGDIERSFRVSCLLQSPIPNTSHPGRAGPHVCAAARYISVILLPCSTNLEASLLSPLPLLSASCSFSSADGPSLLFLSGGLLRGGKQAGDEDVSVV